jgi:hypothetical protein
VSGRQLARLAAVFAALIALWGAAALWRRASAAGPSGEALHLPRIDRSKVDGVVVTKGGDTTRLVRKDSSWTVNGWRASATAVSDLLGALSDTTVTGELVAERRGSQAGLGTDSAGGTRVRVESGGHIVADLMVGKTSPDFSGGYLRPTGQERTWQVQSRLVELVTKPADDWRDHRIAGVASDQVGGVELWHGPRRTAVTRGAAGAWTLSSGGAADSSRVNDMVAAYREVTASGFATPAQADSARFAPADRRVRVLGKDGKPLLTLLFDSTAAGWWVKPDTGTTVYRMESYGADRLVPADSALRPAREAAARK